MMEVVVGKENVYTIERVVYKFSVKAEFRNKTDITYPHFDEIKGALAVSGDIDAAARLLIRAFNFKTPKDEEYLVIRDIKLKYRGSTNQRIIRLNHSDTTYANPEASISL